MITGQHWLASCERNRSSPNLQQLWMNARGPCTTLSWPPCASRPTSRSKARFWEKSQRTIRVFCVVALAISDLAAACGGA
jgi:hypothetical protein